MYVCVGWGGGGGGGGLKGSARWKIVRGRGSLGLQNATFVLHKVRSKGVRQWRCGATYNLVVLNCVLIGNNYADVVLLRHSLHFPEPDLYKNITEIPRKPSLLMLPKLSKCIHSILCSLYFILWPMHDRQLSSLNFITMNILSYFKLSKPSSYELFSIFPKCLKLYLPG